MRRDERMAKPSCVGWVHRGAILGVVIASHIGLVLSVLAMRPIDRDMPRISTARSLEVRFIELPPRRVTSAPPARSVSGDGQRVARAPRASSPRPVPIAAAATPAEPPSSDNPSTGPVATDATPQAGPATFVAGGGLFKNDGAFAGTSARLPGEAPRKGAPALRMVDPRTQGMAGVVRIIGSFTGAVDKHCLDLDAWQGMTPEERVAHHVSEADIAHLRDHYSCGAPRRGSAADG